MSAMLSVGYMLNRSAIWSEARPSSHETLMLPICLEIYANKLASTRSRTKSCQCSAGYAKWGFTKG